MILGIAGLSGSGKDAIADLLFRRFRFTKKALADEMKNAVMRFFAFDEVQLWGPSQERNKPDKRYPREHTWRHPGDSCACCGASYVERIESPCYLTPRYALQLLGSNFGRHCYEDVWVEFVVREARGTMNANPGLSVVVPDVRFKNELSGLKKAGAKLVRVRRVGFEKPKWDHPSETEQMGIPDSEFDYVLENDSTLEALGEKVDEMWKELSK